MSPQPSGSCNVYNDNFEVDDWNDGVAKTHTSHLKDMQAYLRSGGNQILEGDASWFGQFILSQNFEAFGGCVVFVNFIIITLETHARAVGNNEMLEHISIGNRLLLAYYILECSARLYVLRRSFFCGAWNVLDLVIAVTGVISEIMEAIALSSAGVEQISMLKSLRMMRLIRLVRLLVAFRELYVLLAGLGRCMKTLVWASGLIFLVLNVWAIVSVEWLHPITRDLAAEGAFGSCGWCGEAFADVWKANLTWFQVVSGDGWAALGRPLAERAPWTYMFFVTNICVMVWGLLNLVVAAIVDSNIQARDEDVQGAARNAMRARNQAFESFRSLCKEMDNDGDGKVTAEEFKEFKETSIELQQHLEVMGISDRDFDKCLNLMDLDGDGRLDFDEFAQEFSKMRGLVVKTNLYYVLRHVEFLHQSMVDMHADHRQIISGMSELRADIKNMNGVISLGTTNSRAVDAYVSGLTAIANPEIEQDIVAADSRIMQVPVSSSKHLSELSSPDQILFATSQPKHSQLRTDLSSIRCSTSATLDHCKELCKSMAKADVEVVRPSKIEGILVRPRIRSAKTRQPKDDLQPLCYHGAHNFRSDHKSHVAEINDRCA